MSYVVHTRRPRLVFMHPPRVCLPLAATRLPHETFDGMTAVFARLVLAVQLRFGVVCC